LKAWEYAVSRSRGDLVEVIVEEFIQFESEITLLTVTQKDGSTLFCPAIGHRQERGDYQESWQPAALSDTALKTAQDMADKVTAALTGAGIWGVEFFISGDTVWFSELSPRPHDTGMVTLIGSQNFSEFELHARAILGLPIPEITLERVTASAVVLADFESSDYPAISGLEEASKIPQTDFRVFGKPSTRKFRRMAVGLAYEDLSGSTDSVRKIAKQVADSIKISQG
jgi:phosphoribosylglycinamide formyltransferase 2